MGWIKRLLYGVLIGIASIAPGLSGGTIAIALGFYENMISSVANLLKDFKRHFGYLLPYGIGAVISIAALSVVFDYLFAEFPLPTNLLFIGFILGTLPFIRGKFRYSLDGHKHSWIHLCTGIIFFIIVILPVLSGTSGSREISGTVSTNTGSVIMFLVIGIIIAATLVVPGLSGTMILTSLGFYKPLLHTASLFITSVVALDITAATDLLISIVPLGIGVILGGFLIAKVLNLLFQKIPAYIYAAVTGLICATPIVMLAEISISSFTLINIFAGATTLTAGIFLGWKLGESEH